MGIEKMRCRLFSLFFGICGFVLMLWAACSPRWSVSLPTTGNGQPVGIQAYRGLWKQCFGQGGHNGGFNTQCNKYVQSVAEKARMGLVGMRAFQVLGLILVRVSKRLSFPVCSNKVEDP